MPWKRNAGYRDTVSSGKNFLSEAYSAGDVEQDSPSDAIEAASSVHGDQLTIVTILCVSTQLNRAPSFRSVMWRSDY
jgi:hypothetical protein